MNRVGSGGSSGFFLLVWGVCVVHCRQSRLDKAALLRDLSILGKAVLMRGHNMFFLFEEWGKLSRENGRRTGSILIYLKGNIFIVSEVSNSLPCETRGGGGGGRQIIPYKWLSLEVYIRHFFCHLNTMLCIYIGGI